MAARYIPQNFHAIRLTLFCSQELNKQIVSMFEVNKNLPICPMRNIRPPSRQSQFQSQRRPTYNHHNRATLARPNDSFSHAIANSGFLASEQKFPVDQLEEQIVECQKRRIMKWCRCAQWTKRDNASDALPVACWLSKKKADLYLY